MMSRGFVKDPNNKEGKEIICILNDLTMDSMHSGCDHNLSNTLQPEFHGDVGGCSDFHFSGVEQLINYDTVADDWSIGHNDSTKGIRQRIMRNESKGNTECGTRKGSLEESDEMPLLGLDDLLGEIYRLHKKKERTNPYNATKIVNMWKALWPPSMQRLCEEVVMDGWNAVPRELINVTTNSIEEIIKIISFSSYPGANNFIDNVSGIGMTRLRVCHSETNKLILRSGKKTSSKCVVFWSCTFANLWCSKLHLTCFVIAIF